MVAKDNGVGNGANLDRPKFVFEWRHTYKGETIGFIKRFIDDDGEKNDIPYYIKSGTGYKKGIPTELKPLPLFGIDSVTDPGKPVYVVEGQKCQQALQGLGFQAVTSILGATNARSSDWSTLKITSQVILLPDNDLPGEKYVRQVADILKEVGFKGRLAIAQFPDLPKKGDVVNWLQAQPELASWDGLIPLEELSDRAGISLRLEKLLAELSICFEATEIDASSSQQTREAEKVNHVPMWPALKEAALAGMIGEFVQRAAKNSEADPAAILFNLLPFLGCIIGPNTYLEIGDDRHPARLFTLTVGATGRGRKGTAAAPVKKLARAIDIALTVRVSPGPLSSGEGLIYAVRDPSEDEDENGKPLDPGVDDKRLYVLSSEFASVLAVFKREGNTLPTTLRAIWDDGDLDPLTKNKKTRATGAHIAITSHITREEWLKKLEETEVYSGTMNRFLLACVRRSKHVPNPEPLDPTWLEEFARRISDKLRAAQNQGTIQLTEDAQKHWEEIYPQVSKDEAGLVGAFTCRSESLTKRVALLYALLDSWTDKPVVDVCHLRCALAVIDFSRDSARFIFGSSESSAERDKLCQRILGAISATSGGITQSSISNALNRNIEGTKLNAALEHLQAVGAITQFKGAKKDADKKSPGRTATVWKITPGFVFNNEINESDEEIDE